MSRDQQLRERVVEKIAQITDAQNKVVEALTERARRAPVLHERHAERLLLIEAQLDAIRQDLVEDEALIEARLLVDLQSPPPPPVAAATTPRPPRARPAEQMRTGTRGALGPFGGALLAPRAPALNHNRRGHRS